MLLRFRSAWLSKNLTLLVLRLLRESTLSEWEILSRLHSRYGFTPSAREFERLEKELQDGGYATLALRGERSNLQITTRGIGLLVRLEEEHRTVVSTIGPPRSASHSAVTP